ncbi:MAG: response regulator transcription factor, partial [Dehalococcoidia bacterium]
AGSTNREIGNALFLSHRTVATHVSNLLAKLDAPTRTGAVAAAVRRGLVDAEPHLHHLSGGGAAIDSINSVN